MDWLVTIGNMIAHIPFERVLFPPRDSTKALEEFAAGLKPSESPKEAPISEKPPSSAKHTQIATATPVVTRENLDLGTLAYQEQKAYNELWLAESHAKEDFVGCGTDVDCGFKHGLNFVAIAQETKSMTTDPVWDEIEHLGWELQEKAHPDRVRERTHHQEYQELAIKISKPRREIQKRIMATRAPVINLQEAQAIAAEEAAKEVERKWH